MLHTTEITEDINPWYEDHELMSSNSDNTEKELRDSEERLKILFEHAPDAYYINDLKGNFIDGNKASENLLGFQREELIGKNFFKANILPYSEIPKATALLARNILGHSTGPDEFQLNKKDGSKVYVEIRTFPVKIKRKTVVLGIARDITKRKQNEEKIKASLKEKDVMLREIHHRVKNNMQIILSLLRVQSREIQDEKTQDIIKQCQNRIMAMSAVHESLYSNGDLAQIDFSLYLGKLTTHLLAMYKNGTNGIHLEYKVKNVFLNINSAIPCGLIISELVSNSLKHAFPGKRKGGILVNMHMNKKGIYTLTVEDNGVGFPRGVDLQNTETLGLQLINDLTKQLKGKIEFKTKEGAAIKVTFSADQTKIPQSAGTHQG